IQRSDPAPPLTYVPTPPMLAAPLTAFAAPPCQPRPVPLMAPQEVVNNRISLGLSITSAMKVVARRPQNDDPCGKVTYGVKSNQSEHMEVARLDWQQSQKHSLFGRFFVTNLNI